MKKELMTGRWAHTHQVEVTDPVDGRKSGTRRSDVMTLSDDGTYKREFISTIPGDEPGFSHAGRWKLKGKTLSLSFTREDSSLGKVKGQISVIDEYSIRINGRFYSKSSRPFTRRPD
ncbi:hypothetical protein ACFL3H_08185 [Gemmatimonadota bacterium]